MNFSDNFDNKKYTNQLNKFYQSFIIKKTNQFNKFYQSFINKNLKMNTSYTLLVLLCLLAMYVPIGHSKFLINREYASSTTAKEDLEKRCLEGYQIAISKSFDKCLSLPTTNLTSAEPGIGAILEDCDYAPAQLFLYDPITNVISPAGRTDLCLTTPEGWVATHDTLMLYSGISFYSCNGDKRQSWSQEQGGLIRSDTFTNFCLSHYNDVTSDTLINVFGWSCSDPDGTTVWYWRSATVC